MAEIRIKPSKFIFEQAKLIYNQKNSTPLLSYQTPTNDCIFQAILDFLDDNFDEIVLHQPETPIIQQNADLNDNDSQPEYRR